MTTDPNGQVRSQYLIDVVVKVGGGLLAHPAHLEAVLVALDAAAAKCRMLVVPGGGPFADAVRELDRRLNLDDSASHWMAILAMDQYACLLVSRLRCAGLVFEPEEARSALSRGQLPVLAPFRWLRGVDPLPHSWDVTSDSIAAWVAGSVCARRLVLVKPPGAVAPAVDPYFAHVLPDDFASVDVVPGDKPGALLRCLTV